MSKQDTVSPPTMAGTMIVFPTNGSFFGFAFTRLFLDHDRWRRSAVAGTGDQNSQTGLESIDIPPGI
ncbi:hypothetical protein [Robertkochia aurantiaca]|uniref:hypothetical protein n=1 Tax=Robertkochia aurantiaca TaxID=2873700 RepID=UPI001CCDFF53|nr:hypothetical protein [Robertkochia sp. 3YJGBD-33]